MMKLMTTGTVRETTPGKHSRFEPLNRNGAPASGHGAVIWPAHRAVAGGRRSKSILHGVVFGILILAIKVQAQPALNLQRPSSTNANLRLTWPAPASGFSLEETETLQGSPLWQTAGALPIVDSNRFVVTLLPAGTNRFFRLRRLVFNQAPSDPAQAAPPLAATSTTSFADATSFLYSGSNAVQIGVAPGTLAQTRVAVLRGAVKRTDGA